MASKQTVALGGIVAVVALLALAIVLMDRPQRGVSRPVVDEGDTSTATLPAASDPEQVEESAARKPVRSKSEEPEVERSPVLVYGVLVDPEGTPIERAAVALTSPDGIDRPYPYENRRNPAFGRYAMPGIQPGKIRVTARAEGYHSIDGTLDIGVEPYRRLDLVLEPMIRIPIRFETNGGSLGPWTRNLSVVATSDPPGELLPMRSSSSHAQFGLGRWHSSSYGNTGSRLEAPLGCDGVLCVREDLPVYVSAMFKNVPLATELVTRPEELTLEISVDAIDAALGTLKVRFLEKGLPKAGVSVNAGNVQGGGGSGESGDDGTVEVEGVEPGLLKVRCTLYDATKKRSFQHVEFIRVSPGETIDLGTFDYDIDQGVPIELVDEQGEPRSGNVWFRFLDRLRPDEPLSPHSSYAIGIDGKVELPLALGGRYVVYGRGGDGGFDPGAYATSRDGWITRGRVVDSRGDRDGPVRLVLHRPSRVYLDFGDASTDVEWYRVLDDAGVPVASDAVRADVFPLDLLPGAYTLHVTHEHDSSGRTIPFELGDEDLYVRADVASAGASPVTLVSGGPPAVELEPLPDSAIARNEGSYDPPEPSDLSGTLMTGSVFDADGERVARPSVYVRNAQRDSASAVIEGDTYAVQGLAPGAWTAYVGAPGFKKKEFEFEIAADVAVYERDFVLDQRTIDIDVKVLTPEGAPLIRTLYERIEPQHAALSTALHRATVIATVAPPPAAFPEGTDPRRAGDAGRGSTSFGRVSGPITITEPLPVYVSLAIGEDVFAATEVTAPIEELELVVDPDEVFARAESRITVVTLRVVDADSGETLRPLSAMILPMNSFRGGNLPPKYDGDGRIVLNAPGHGSLKIDVEVEGYEPYRETIEVPRQPTFDLGVVRLARATSIRGMIVDEEGEPLRCAFSYHPEGATDPSARLYGRTDERGAFEIECAPGPHVLRPDAGLDLATQAFRFECGDEAGQALRFELARGTEVRLSASASRRLRVIDAAGLDLSVVHFHGGRENTLRLVPGNYEVEILAGDDVVETRTLAVGSLPVAFELE